ncbi:unnamed protein product [Bursaphelenchus xylophilus]|uniref:(pine wood nematode) hypothetical protein n=1 Tax=Bursaphelenchus xylophilus TaxID=6326 RepID=A0A1I7S9G5_BURXY|nr:unnamed protein product [Bursaphelenchus xylophilus]CAG9111085.1 unnamed protein product [Bursaphelenchus xylophilus]
MDCMEVLVIGDPLFGKSLLSERFALATRAYCVIEPYIHRVIHQHTDGSSVQFSLMNLPNEDIRANDFSKANAILLLFDEDDVESLEKLQTLWLDKFEQLCESSLIAVCGLTSFLHREKLFYHAEPSRVDIDRFVEQADATCYFSVDLGSHEQIFQVFDRLCSEFYVPKVQKRERSLSLKSLKSLKFW